MQPLKYNIVKRVCVFVILSHEIGVWLKVLKLFTKLNDEYRNGKLCRDLLILCGKNGS